MLSITLLQTAVGISGTNGPGLRGLGPLGLQNIQPLEGAPLIFTVVMSNVIGFLTIVAGIWFLFNIIIAGLMWLSASGDKQKLAEAQAKITHSVMGFVIVVVAIFFFRLIANLLNIEDILTPSRLVNIILKP